MKVAKGPVIRTLCRLEDHLILLRFLALAVVEKPVHSMLNVMLTAIIFDREHV